MDEILYALLGAGITLFAAALLIKRPAPGVATLDRTELENTLRRFVERIRGENEQALTEWRSREAALHRELAELRKRVNSLEQELALANDALAAAGNSRAGEPDKAAEDVFALKERYRRVFEWQAQGLGAEEIAKRLGAGQGEIELILSLAASRKGESAHG